MNNKSNVVVVGDIFADLTTYIHSYPANGDATYGTPCVRNGGGCGANMAAGLGVLGVPTTMFCRLGDDENGHFLKNDLAKSGVDVQGIPLDPDAPTGTTIITVDPQGERTVWVLSVNSAYEKLSESDVAFLDELNPSAIIISGVLLGVHPAEETAIYVAEKWRGKTRLYFDPNLRYPVDAVPPALKSAMIRVCDLCDVILTGESEMRALGFWPKPNQIYIVKCGKKGSKYLNDKGEEVFSVPAIECDAVDATGAGDTYVAAFVAAERDGKDLKSAMEYATVAAGLSVTRQGARSMPSREEIETRLKEWIR